jgi:hypothetical protein
MFGACSMGFMQKLRFSLQRRNEPAGCRRRSKDPMVRLKHCLGDSAFSGVAMRQSVNKY